MSPERQTVRVSLSTYPKYIYPHCMGWLECCMTCAETTLMGVKDTVHAMITTKTNYLYVLTYSTFTIITLNLILMGKNTKQSIHASKPNKDPQVIKT